MGENGVLRTTVMKQAKLSNIKPDILPIDSQIHKYNIDYNETFSPSSISSSVKVVLSIIASEVLICQQMYISTAVLKGELDVDIL